MCVAGWPGGENTSRQAWRAALGFASCISLPVPPAAPVACCSPPAEHEASRLGIPSNCSPSHPLICPPTHAGAAGASACLSALPASSTNFVAVALLFLLLGPTMLALACLAGGRWPPQQLHAGAWDAAGGPARLGNTLCCAVLCCRRRGALPHRGAPAPAWGRHCGERWGEWREMASV